MDWRTGRAIEGESLQRNKRYSTDGTPRPRGWRPHKKWRRAGAQRHRGRQTISPKDPDATIVFFAYITSLSEKAKVRVIERNDDVLLLVETHSNRTGTDLALKLLATHSWCSTASPAQLTPRSELGTAGGVLAAIRTSTRAER